MWITLALLWGGGALACLGGMIMSPTQMPGSTVSQKNIAFSRDGQCYVLLVSEVLMLWLIVVFKCSFVIVVI